MSAQLRRIQSAPASRNAGCWTVVVKATTLAPAAFPDRTPAGTSSNTTHCAAGNPSMAAPFRYGSGFGLPCVMSFEVIIFLGNGSPAALIRTSANGRVHDVTMVQRSVG